MVNNPDTDSHFDLADAPSPQSDKMAEVRLIHESTAGYCAVYSGVYRGRRVAFKVLKPQYRASELHRQMLRKEFEVASMMNHPNIIATLRMENLPGPGEAILMEQIEGLTLKEYLEANPRLSGKQQRSITEQICQAVSYIHSRQTIHCDLKPSNILLTADGRFVKVIDFGMSRGNGFETLDFGGGTQGFTAPENFSAGSQATVATDIYSIGKIMELMDRGGAMKSVWLRCTAANPADRPGSAGEIIELLRRRRSKIIPALVPALIAAVGLFFLLRDTAPEVAPEPVENQDTIATAPVSIEREDTPPLSAPEAATPAAESKEIATARPFEERLAEKFEEVALTRFKEHIQLIDTMTTRRSWELQQVSHWRWLAKQDMKRWLTETPDATPQQIEQEMDRMDHRLDEFMRTSDRTFTELVNRKYASARKRDLSGYATKQAYYEGADTLVVRRLGEDGVWRETRTRVPVDGLDSEGATKTRDEAMKKALAD